MEFCSHERDSPACAKIYCESYGDARVWPAFDPVSRLIAAFVIGKRTRENADLLSDRVKDVTDAHIPFFTSDRLPEYDNALLHTYGVRVQPERSGTRGRYPKPRLVQMICYTHRSSKYAKMDG